MYVNFSNKPDVKFERSSNPDFTYISRRITIKINVRSHGYSIEELSLLLIIKDRPEGFYFDDKKVPFKDIYSIKNGENDVDVHYYTDLKNPAQMASINMKVILFKNVPDRSTDDAEPIDSATESFNILP
ncbi:hypothetical protein L6773_13125 [Rhodohalobacter sp. WB101]|uniref:Uncharacterized protein n=1 Tax=Rhodohalobacter sulfatireducens TaxID=2911366 RepID=A0ABS9KFC5_9BACT|nr:hypothetical protein [Rhodohalobacter sulfatireducens]